MTRKAPSERGIFSAIIFFFRLDLSLPPPSREAGALFSKTQCKKNSSEIIKVIKDYKRQHIY